MAIKKNQEPSGKALGDYTEEDLKNFTQDPFIDYATGEVVDEGVLKKDIPGPRDLELEKSVSQMLVQKFLEHLKEYGDISVFDLIDRFSSDEKFAQSLTEAFAEAGYIIKRNPVRPPMPDAAPRLWNDRNKQTERNPAEFIRTVYAQWLPHLARQDIRRRDMPLYVSYAQWVRPERHPEDEIKFAEGYGKARIEDPAEAIERRRASVRASTNRRRQTQRDGQNVASADDATDNSIRCITPKFE